MNRANNIGMAIHQTIGFGRLTSVIPKAEAVFWPGCGLLNLDPELLDKTLEVLRREAPDIRMAAACCGQPSRYLFPEKWSRRQAALQRRLKAQGIKRIYTACPNCKVELGKLEGVEIRTIWEVLAKHVQPREVSRVSGSYVWHDPCPTRNDPETQQACRVLLALSGQPVAQPEHTGANTRCCGNVGMLQVRDPGKSAEMRKARLSELGNRTVISGCEGCLDAFRMEGQTTLHLLEFLFGKSSSRGYRNRLITTRKAKH